MEPRQQPAQEACAHRWQIKPPTGTYSTGVCTKCQAERIFANAPEFSSYGYGRTRPRPAT